MDMALRAPDRRIHVTSPVNAPPEVPDPIDRATLTVAEVADLFGIGLSAAYKAVNAGEIPAIRIGNRLLVPTAAVRRMLLIDEHDGASAAESAGPFA